MLSFPVTVALTLGVPSLPPLPKSQRQPRLILKFHRFERSARPTVFECLPRVGGNVRGATGGVRLDQDPERGHSSPPLRGHRLHQLHHDEHEIQQPHRGV